MKTFEREISWVIWEFDADKNDTVEKTRTKTATFNELNRTDKSQHKLHFKLISLFQGLEGSAESAEDINVSTDALYDITCKAIKTLIVTDGEKFTKTDLEEFLNDSMAILPFGLWMLKEKFSPFFKNLSMS